MSEDQLASMGMRSNGGVAWRKSTTTSTPGDAYSESRHRVEVRYSRRVEDARSRLDIASGIKMCRSSTADRSSTLDHNSTMCAIEWRRFGTPDRSSTLD